MKKRLFFLATFLLTLLYGVTFAQERTISGTVTGESGDTLPGATVQIKGTTTGVVTDLDGKFKMSIPDGEGTMLVISFVGMENQEVVVGNQSVIDVTMSDSNVLTEVVVTGYQTFTKEKSSISSTTVSSESIGSRPNASFVQTLSGQVPGLNITTNSGQPGATPVVQLRGVNSISGNTQPLFIIDGAPVDASLFRSLNPNEIASITVLKDAGSTAIYGNRGANGVILITTKKGGFNSPLEIDYSYQFSSSSLQKNKYGLMSAQEQLQLEKTFGRGRGAGMTDAEIAGVQHSDWVDYFFDQGISQSHNLQFKKGGDQTTTYLSLGYTDTEGILQNSGLKRYNLRSNVTGKSKNDKFNYGLNLSVNYAQNEEPSSIGTGGVNQNYVLGAYISAPYISPDEYSDGQELVNTFSGLGDTPLFLIDKQKTFVRDEDELKMIASLNFNYKIIDGLVASFRSSGDFLEFKRLTSQSPDAFNSILFGNTGRQSHTNIQEFLYNQVANINYTKEIDKHTLSFGVYSEYFKAHRAFTTFTNKGLDSKTYSPGDGQGFIADNSNDDRNSNTVDASLLNAGLFSYFGSIDYDYDSRFGFSTTLRRDATSRFAESNRWGTFYSVAGRWNLHNEAFAAGLPFDVLKLRGSYGKTGNQDIIGTGYFGALNFTRSLFETGKGYGGANSLSLLRIGNTTLKWEEVYQANIGIDAEVFDGRLRTSFDVYFKTTKDLFLATPISSINDATSIRANIGELKNRGIDFSVQYDILRQTDGINLTIGLVGNYNKQEVVKLAPNQEQLLDPNATGVGLRLGGIFKEHFLVRYAGVNPENGNLLYLTADGEITETPDQDKDRVWLDKSIYPDIQGGITLNADYKGIYLALQFNYSIGRYRFDGDLSNYQDPGNIGTFRSSTDLLRAWTPENTNTDIPRLGVSNDIGFRSDRYLKSADFLRLRFMSIGYNVPKEYLSKVGLRSAKVFVNAENFITFTKWIGFDVEAAPGLLGTGAGNNSNQYQYPTPKTFSIGVQIGL